MRNDAHKLLESWFQFATEDALVIDTDHISTEAIGNLCVFSPPPDVNPDVDEVIAFISRVAVHRASQLPGHAMTFYCWHDVQVRQLRLSLVSRVHGCLPFGCHHVQTQDIDSVVRPIIYGDWRNQWYTDYKEDPADDHLDDEGPLYTEQRPLKVGVIALG